MHAADDDPSTLLPASSGIERDAADKAESAARAAASRVTAWLQRSPTGPLARASCDTASALAAPEARTTTADAEPTPTNDESSEASDDEADTASTSRPTAELDSKDASASPTLTPVPAPSAD